MTSTRPQKKDPTSRDETGSVLFLTTTNKPEGIGGHHRSTRETGTTGKARIATACGNLVAVTARTQASNSLEQGEYTKRCYVARLRRLFVLFVLILLAETSGITGNDQLWLTVTSTVRMASALESAKKTENTTKKEEIKKESKANVNKQGTKMDAKGNAKGNVTVKATGNRNGNRICNPGATYQEYVDEDDDGSGAGKYVITPSMTLVRRKHISLSPFIDGEAYGDVSLIVLDTEGLAYHTSFTRKLLWVTKITDNLLNVKKPYVHIQPDTCALDYVSTKDARWKKHGHENHEGPKQGTSSEKSSEEEKKKPILGRHLVPSYDGYIYCVYENNQTQLLHIHVRDIVNYTPFRTPLLEGVYLEGSRNSSVMALDYDTGSYITRHGKSDADRDSDRYDEFGNKIRRQRQLQIGYTDWSVRAFNEKTHEELWNFNWREVGAVNSDQLDVVTIERIREAVKVKGKTLHILYNDNAEASAAELNYPFPIAVVFAVMWNAKDEIMTLHVLERISLPPPPEFLQGAIEGSFAALSLKSSNYAGKNVLSVKNGVIDVDDTWDAKRRIKDHPSDGSLVEIKTVDPRHYRSTDTQVQKANIVHHIQSDGAWVKFWVMVGWLFALSTIPFLALIRKITRYAGIDRLLQRVSRHPWVVRFKDRVSRKVMELEDAGFTSTERFIYNIDRASQIYPVDVVYKRITGLPDLPVHMGGSANNRAQLTLLNTLHNMTVAANAGGGQQSKTLGMGEVAKSQEESGSSIKSISVVPHGTPLEGFLENARFIRTFECKQILGKGGFGSVYMVQHKLEPGRPIYAMKFVLLWLRPSEGLGSRRYFREVSANREIYSKYVVRYFTWWCEEPHFLPMMELSPDIRAAAALNIRHLINTNALTSENTKELSGFLQKYQDAVRDIVERSNEDSYPSFSKIAFNRTTRAQMRKNRETLVAIGEHSELSNDWSYDSEDSVLGSPVHRFVKEADRKDKESKDNWEEIGYHYSDSGVDIVFEDSQSEPAVETENKPVEDVAETLKQAKQRTRVPPAQPKEVEKQYPVVMLILMELCKGCTLREWLNRPERSDVPLDYTEGPTGMPVEFFLFKQLIKGLRDIHANNFIHRDLKPENIFVDPVTYALKIGDFGLVAIISHGKANDDSQQPSPAAELNDENEQVSLPGQVIGTPGYTAPEGGVNCTEKADIYSAALILLELLLPRFSTSMERCTVLEDFRTSRTVPAYIKEQLQPWYDLLWTMADPVPTKRPTAAVIQITLKVILGSAKSEPLE